MPGRRHSIDEIREKLSNAEALKSQGRSVQDICASLGVSKQTYFRWRRDLADVDDTLEVDGMSTREKIMDAAEELLANHGLATSLREIMRAADVNIAAVHYHFGDKDGLIDALMHRRLSLINSERIAQLEDALNNKGKLTLNRVVEAYLGPSVRASLDTDTGRANFMKFLVRLINDPSQGSQGRLTETYRSLHPKFTKAFKTLFPDMPDKHFYWRYHAMISVLGSTIHNRIRVGRLSGGKVGEEDFSETIGILIPIVTGIWKSRVPR